jgi:uncharacterized protein YjbI with pentapeptide repeats
MCESAPGLRDRILSRYSEGERDFRGGDFDEAGVLDFRGANLAGADFSECFIFGDFRGANLVGCRFDRANVKTCDFRGAILRGARFVEAAIDGAEFDETAVAADFEGATSYGHTYRGNEKPIAT